MGEKVCVFIVLIREKGSRKPFVYKESLSAPGARELARCLALAGLRTSVIRFDIKATDLANLRLGGHALPITRKRA